MSETTASEEAATHGRLVQLAEKWLWRQNCGVVFRDNFRAATQTGEQPDAIGWRHTVSIMVECKASRSDFLADKSKPFRRDGGMGDWRFYLCPTGMIAPAELPLGWGLLYAAGSRVSPVAGIPGNTGWHEQRPFVGAKEAELQMFYAALRRMVVRGHFASIYEPIPTGVFAA